MASKEEEEIELHQPSSTKSIQCTSTDAQCKQVPPAKKPFASFPGLGMLLALLAGLSFSVASLIIKLLPNVHPLAILFGRSIIQLVIFMPVVIFNGFSIWGVKNERAALCLRILFGSMAISGLYYSVRIMPLADASTIIFSSPALTGILACLFLKEPCGVFEVCTVFFVLVGVVLVCKPTFIFGGAAYDYQLEGTLAAINSAITQALVLVCLRKMRKTPSSVIIVTFSVVVAIECVIVLSILQNITVPLCGTESGLFLACGLMSSLGQILITTASKLEKAGPLSVIRTTDIIMAFMFQVSLLGVYPSWTSIVGAVIVCMTVLILGMKKWYSEKPSFFRCLRR